jgi:hypothetical protein
MSALTQADKLTPATGRSRERGGARLADLAWLAWSQDVTPQRWLWTKLAVLGAMTAAAGAAVSAAADHLAAVVNTATGQSIFSGNAFLVTGMLPLVQSVVWLAVGVALGAAFRRTLPAIFTALIGYGAAYLLVERVYPSLMAPVTALAPLGDDHGSAARLGANSLVVANPSGTIYNASGHPVSPALQSLCQSANDLPKGQLNPCLAPQRHLMTLLRYQPGSRIPDFHLILIGGYLGLGTVAAVILWWLVQRTSLSAG